MLHTKQQVLPSHPVSLSVRLSLKLTVTTALLNNGRTDADADMLAPSLGAVQGIPTRLEESLSLKLEEAHFNFYLVPCNV